MKTSSKTLELEVRRFQEEVVEHVPSLLAVSRRLCRNSAESEDLVQDTVIKAIRARKQFQAGTNLKAWLMKILRNAFINRYHRAAIERSALATPAGDPIIDSWMSQASMKSMRDPDSFGLRPELQSALIQAIERLPDDFKEVILLTDAEGFSYREVSEMLGCPMGTVMSRLHRARRLLKADLIEHAKLLGLVQPEPQLGVVVTQDQANTPSRSDAPIEGSDAPIELDSYRTARASAAGSAARGRRRS